MAFLRRDSQRRPALVAVVGAALAVGMTGCADQVVTGEGSAPRVLVVSDAWVRDNQVTDAGSGGSGAGAGADDVVQERLSSLTETIERLRAETGTGWTGRQDDATGYLGQLSGGSRLGTPESLLDDYGPALFGVETTDLVLGEPDSVSVPGATSWRATQVVGDVPVLDGFLVVTARLGDLGMADDRVTGLNGRVFPGLVVDTEPALGAGRAAQIAETASRGTLQRAPELAVLPIDTGRLAWAVAVAAPSNGSTSLAGAIYYVDAVTGDLLTIRPGSAEVRGPLPYAEPDPGSVEVTGKNPIGGTLTAYGVRTDQEVSLVDTTTPTWDQATGRGGLYTYDASGVKNSAGLPGELVTSQDTTIRDPEAIAAHALSREVYDYYAGLGRKSWDGEGGPLVSSVNYGREDFCNSFFTTSVEPPQMIYGNPCTVSSGPVEVTEVEIDTAGHEITHGVTATSAGLVYTGQSGALNESFSDYFGNVIGNLVKGTDSVAIFEGGCTGYTEETLFCTRNPDGSLSLRYMMTGDDFDDYLRVLDVGFRLAELGVADQDNGGVHFNSAIWNNALWSIRTRLAQIDGTTGNESPMAQDFDRAVYAALTTRLTSAAGFVDARAAVEQVIVDSSLDPVVLRVAREVFDANKICTGCPTTGPLGGDTVSASPQTQLHPTVSGDQFAWLDLSAGADLFGYAATSRLGGAPSVGPASDVVEVAFAGDALLTLDLNGRILRYDGPNARPAAKVQFYPALAAGLAGSDQGGAWASGDDTVSFVDPAGTVTDGQLPDLGGDSVVGLGTGGGYVGIGTDAGRVLGWRPGGKISVIGRMQGAVVSVAAYDGNILAVDDEGQAMLFTASGEQLGLSSRAAPFGVAMSGEYAVWPEVKGALEAGVAGGASPFPETDLYLLSLETGSIYDLIPAQGQQGFPTISGRRLAWQDAAFGGDDILTAVLPAGL